MLTMNSDRGSVQEYVDDRDLGYTDDEIVDGIVRNGVAAYCETVR